VAEFGRGSGPWRDRQWTSAATHIIRRHKPNLLLFHLLNLDSTHHRYGPGTPAGATGIAFADDRVKEILDALRDAGRLERSTVLVVSDHGFKNVRRVVHPNVALRQNGLIRTVEARTSCDAWVVPEGGTALVYITDPANRTRLAPKVRDILSKVEGVARVIEPSEFGALGLPKPGETGQAPDLVLAAAEGHAFGGAHEGVAAVDQAAGGSHGYLNTDPDMEAVFIAWGHGIKKGARLDVVQNVDIAPTIAELLGLRLEGAAGKPVALQ
jgi:predicted AlkP superfamily pyrophosphatase or phosphodiesterase